MIRDVCTPVLYQTGRRVECRYFDGCPECEEPPSALMEAIRRGDTVLSLRRSNGLRQVEVVGSDKSRTAVWKACQRHAHGVLIDAGYTYCVHVGDSYAWIPKAELEDLRRAVCEEE